MPAVKFGEMFLFSRETTQAHERDDADDQAPADFRREPENELLGAMIDIQVQTSDPDEWGQKASGTMPRKNAAKARERSMRSHRPIAPMGRTPPRSWF